MLTIHKFYLIFSKIILFCLFSTELFTQQLKIINNNKNIDFSIVEEILLKNEKGRYNQTYGVYESYINTCFIYFNNTDSLINSISFSYELRDLNGKFIISGNINENISIEPNERIVSQNCGFYDKNELTIYELPYDRLYNLIKSNHGKLLLSNVNIKFSGFKKRFENQPIGLKMKLENDKKLSEIEEIYGNNNYSNNSNDWFTSDDDRILSVQFLKSKEDIGGFSLQFLVVNSFGIYISGLYNGGSINKNGDDYYDFSENKARFILGDKEIRRQTSTFSNEFGLIKSFNDYLSISINYAIYESEEYIAFFDKFEILGIDGSYWITKDNSLVEKTGISYYLHLNNTIKDKLTINGTIGYNPFYGAVIGLGFGVKLKMK